MNVVLRAATADDAPFLAQLFRDVRAPEFAALGMTPAMLEPLLHMQHIAQKQGYAAQFPAAQDQIVLVDGDPAGRLLVARSASGLHLIDIALLEQFRGNGIGRGLLQGLCEEAGAASLSVLLSVRNGNPAERLYQTLGFVPTGTDGVYTTMVFHRLPEA